MAFLAKLASCVYAGASRPMARHQLRLGAEANLPANARLEMLQGVVQDGVFDRLGYPVGVRAAGAGRAVEQALGAIGLEIAADLVELLAAVAQQLAGLGDIAKVGGRLQQRQLASCYFVLRGHVSLRSGQD